MKKCLVVGRGWVAKNRHLPVLKRLGYSCDVYGKDIEYDALSAHYEFALVCVPPDVRYEVFNSLVKVGIKKFFLEKPLASNIKDAEAIQSVARKSGVEVHSTHNFIFAKSGRALLCSKHVERILVFQLNRSDRVLPPWVNKLPYGIELDEFPHAGYLCLAFSDLGINDPKVTFVNDSNSPINRWEIVWYTNDTEVTADLWRDSIYVHTGHPQRAFWQYKLEGSEAFQRLKQLFHRIFFRLLGKSNDFGTEVMWRAFLIDGMSEREEYLTSLDSSVNILRHFYQAHGGEL